MVIELSVKLVMDPRLTGPTAHEVTPLHDSPNSKHERSHHSSQRSSRPPRDLYQPSRRSSSISRLITFLLLETAFLVLGVHCLLKPTTLALSSESTDDTPLREAKAAVTALTIIWHALAALVAQDLVARVFSAECLAQYRLTGTLEPGKTDIVSTVTTGLLERTKHFFSRDPTSQFRVAFLAAVTLMVLGPIGPAVLSVGSIPVRTLEEIQLGEVTVNQSLFSKDAGSSEDYASQRAELALRMETIEKITFGYETEDDRILIPWPQMDLRFQEEAITYLTDVVTYDYDCSWNAPVVQNKSFSLNESLSGYAVGVDGTQWQVRMGQAVDDPLLGSGMVAPLVNTAHLSSPQGSYSGFFFIDTVWTDSSGSELSQNKPVLESFPSTNISILSDNGSVLGARSTVLLCKPHLRILPGIVLLQGGKLRMDKLARNQELPRGGNLVDSAVNGMFSQAFVSATEPPAFIRGDPGAVLLSEHANFLFFNSSNIILPPTDINRNMNSYLSIAAKAYLSGAYVREGTQQLMRNWKPQNGTRVHEKTALVTSKPFLLALGCIIGFLGLLLSRLLAMISYDDMQLFDLHNFTIRSPET